MVKVFLFVFTGFVLFSCKSAKHENKPVTIKEFLKLYKPLSLPVNFSDSNIAAISDTTTIAYDVFSKFIPDSAISNVLNNQPNGFVIHPAGIIHTEKVDYLLTKFTSAKITKLAVFILDVKHLYKTYLLLLLNKYDDKYHYSVSVTNEPTFIIRREKTDSANQVLYSRNGYAYSASTNSFGTVLNDSNEDEKKKNEVINPIDTFVAVNKWSGDYVLDKQSFISVRDGKNQFIYKFFIHFEKNKNACIGELKGEMRFTNATNAIYQESGDPCVMNFKFTANTIKVKEEGNCGNYRGITCPFDFNFKKKKPLKPKNLK